MQSTILFLQQELKTSKESIGQLEAEIVTLKSGSNSTGNNTPADVKQQPQNGYGLMANQDAPDQPHAIDNSNEMLKTNASDRTLRNDRASSTTNPNVVGKVVQAPRTLRSSSRNISNDDNVCGGKVNNRTARNGNCEMYDDSEMDDKYTTDDNTDSANVESTDKQNGKTTTVKRSFDTAESDSSDDGHDYPSNMDKNNVKKMRRSSVLTSDADEVDNRLEIGANERSNTVGDHESNGASDD